MPIRVYRDLSAVEITALVETRADAMPARHGC